MTKIKYDKETYNSEVTPTEFGYYFTIYQITNLINGKIYVGKSKTKNLLNNYVGSGKLLHLAYNKYGLENFEKKYLFFLNSESEMNAKEKEIVNEDFVAREDTYNLKVGGDGNWAYINEERKHWSSCKKEEFGKKMAESVSKYTQSLERRELSKNTLIKNNKARKGEKNPNISKAWTKEKREELSKKKLGSNNPMYGKIWIINLDTLERKIWNSSLEIPSGFVSAKTFSEMKYNRHLEKANYIGQSKQISTKSHNSRWITNGISNKFVLKEKLDEYLKAGWRFGRT